VDFNATGQLLILHSAFVNYLRKNYNAYDSLRKEVLYNFLTEFGIPIKLVRLIKVCLNETYSIFRYANICLTFYDKNGSKQADALSSLLFSSALDYAFRRVQVNQDGLKLNNTHHLLVCADDVNILSGSVRTIKKNTESLVVASK
jgi:hypothetical protein